MEILINGVKISAIIYEVNYRGKSGFGLRMKRAFDFALTFEYLIRIKGKGV